MPEIVSLECLSNGIIRPGARYTFRDPEGREEDRSVVAAGRSYEFTNHPTNESLITCTVIENVESEPVRVVAIPRYTAGVRIINQYVYSDGAVADVVCPFEIGRLRELYEISWSTANTQGNRLAPITNATQGVHWLEEEDNRTLHVNISTPGPLRYQCVGKVQTCRRRTSCWPFSPPSRSPAFMVLPIDHPNITEPPASVTVDQYHSYKNATFNCTATSSGDLIINWNCSDGSNCGMSSTNSSNNGLVTSTLVITHATSSLTVTCGVVQNLTSLSSGESTSIEVRLPWNFVRINTVQSTAQLIVIPVPTTVTQSEITLPGSEGLTSGQVLIIILTLVLLFIITVIIIMSMCSFGIFRYHYKNEETCLGQQLKRIFNLIDPASNITSTRESQDTQPIPHDRETTIAHPINHETRVLMQENSAYGTDIAIAPEIAAGRNLAYGPNMIGRIGDEETIIYENTTIEYELN